MSSFVGGGCVSCHVDYRNVASEGEFVCWFRIANRRETHPKTRLRDGLAGVVSRCFGSISCELVCDHVLLVD